jgi:hypothetical protein
VRRSRSHEGGHRPPAAGDDGCCRGVAPHRLRLPRDVERDVRFVAQHGPATGPWMASFGGAMRRSISAAVMPTATRMPFRTRRSGCSGLAQTWPEPAPVWSTPRYTASRKCTNASSTRALLRPHDPLQRGPRPSEPGPAVPAGEARSHSAHAKSHHPGDAYAAIEVATVQKRRGLREEVPQEASVKQFCASGALGPSACS